jgi:hypothetical protein
MKYSIRDPHSDHVVTIKLNKWLGNFNAIFTDQLKCDVRHPAVSPVLTNGINTPSNTRQLEIMHDLQVGSYV